MEKNKFDLAKVTLKQWIKGGVMTALWLAFVIWIEEYWLLVTLPLVMDIYTTRVVCWGWYRDVKNSFLRSVLSWTFDILFALVAVYLINNYVFQNYQIPSPSLEKSLLVGDYLLVDKTVYGARSPMTPLSFPLAQHTMPFVGGKSYIEWPQWRYNRIAGRRSVERNDIVVFNYPAGDSVCSLMENPDYYTLCAEYGKSYLEQNKRIFGELTYRPVDRRENYVKRCVGLPGDTLQIIDNEVFIDGAPGYVPQHLQFNYLLQTDGSAFTSEDMELLGVSQDDRMTFSPAGHDEEYFRKLGFATDAAGSFYPLYRLPLTKAAFALAKEMKKVKEIVMEPTAFGGTTYYPQHYDNGWTRDNYGPLWIPRRGATIELTDVNLALYGRCIRNFEGHSLAYDAEGKPMIDGVRADSFTFAMDYYFMMGDNRHNSADSRMWGFVPEDHIVGSPLFVWLSLDKDKAWFGGKIRWSRIFTSADVK